MESGERGLAIGPSGINLITEQNLSAIGVFSEVALGLILFSIGAVFHFERFRTIGRNVLLITLTESIIVGIAMFLAMSALGQSWQVALLLAVISTETAAASTLMVMRECNADGPLTETLVGVIAVYNVLCLTLFTVALSLIGLSAGLENAASGWAMLYDAAYRVLGS